MLIRHNQCNRKEKNLVPLVFCSVVLVLIVGAFFGPEIYNSLRKRYIPGYYSYWPFSFDREIYQEGQTCFPGNRVNIGLKQSTIQGAHLITDVSVSIPGYCISDINYTGYQHSFISEKGNKIFYKARLEVLHNIGWIDSKLPGDIALYGKSLSLSYRLTFYFPEVLAGSQYFEWKPKPLSDTHIIKIGSLSTHQRIQRAFRIFLIIEGIIILLTIAGCACIFRWAK